MPTLSCLGFRATIVAGLVRVDRYYKPYAVQDKDFVSFASNVKSVSEEFNLPLQS